MKSYRLNKQAGYDKQAVQKWFSVALDSVRNGVYDISITQHRERRSLPQNKLMWLWFWCIAEETGQDKQTIHDYYCSTYLKPELCLYSGREFYRIPSTSSLTTEAFTLFLNQIKADAATELGIILPEPQDLAFIDFLEQYNHQ